MNDFAVGDQVWFFWTDCGRYSWGDDATIVHCKNLYIENGFITDINPKKDTVHVYVKGVLTICEFGYTFHHENLFKTKKEAIDSMTKRLQEMKE